MPSKSPTVRVPAPYLHKPTGQAAVVLRDPDGKRRTVYLGLHGSTDAARRYREVLAAHLAGTKVAPARSRTQA